MLDTEQVSSRRGTSAGGSSLSCRVDGRKWTIVRIELLSFLYAETLTRCDPLVDTIVVQSLDNPDEIGYTDMITIAGGSNNAPSGNSVSLVTIPAPTSTNYGASQKPGISIPSPTAVTGQPTSSSAASRSSALSSASSMSVSSRAGQSSSLSSSSQIASSTASTPSAVSAGTSPSASSTTPSSAASSNLVLQTGTAFFALALAATYCL